MLHIFIIPKYYTYQWVQKTESGDPRTSLIHLVTFDTTTQNYNTSSFFN